MSVKTNHNPGEILMSVLRVTQHMSQVFRSHFGKLNLTFPQALVLTVLGEEGGMPLGQLSEKTGSANSTISGIVDRLEKLGLVRRHRSDQDRRVIYVATTEKYESLRENSVTSVHSYFSEILGELSEDDKKNILNSLNRLDEVLKDALEWAD